MRELKIGERVEVIMFDGSENAGVIKDIGSHDTIICHHKMELELVTLDGTFFGLVIQGRDPEHFWECKLKDVH